MYDLVGVVLGTVLGILNYKRDNHSLAIELRRNWKIIGGEPVYNKDTEYCVLSVTNIGRRPAIVSTPSLIFIDGSNVQFSDAYTINCNKKLEEGDFTQYLMEESCIKEKGILQGWVITSQGTNWYSTPTSLKHKILAAYFRLKRWYTRYFNSF
jgi:hypothetical protein